MLIILFLSQFLWAQDPQLEGVWRQTCANQAVRTEDFAGTAVAFTESYYADKKCDELLLEFTSLGAFTAENGKIDFAFRQINITLHNIHYVDDYNDRHVCGINTWQVGKAEDVTGKFCEIFGPGVGLQIPPQGRMRYGIYKIEEDRLYFGRLSLEHDSSSPEKRPQVFDERFFIRQK